MSLNKPHINIYRNVSFSTYVLRVLCELIPNVNFILLPSNNNFGHIFSYTHTPVITVFLIICIDTLRGYGLKDYFSIKLHNHHEVL
jgi:hypothetical protein